MLPSKEIQELPEQLPVPWYWTDTDLVEQLLIEIPKRHVLFNKQCITIGRRQDNDDVLFQINDDAFQYAVVHLTWSRNRSSDLNYPRTKLYRNWKEVYEQRILADNRFFESLG